ncbi:MAG: hypothetical protein DRP30_06300 [Thermotoga sp.]|nr:MAG: hypothetical protein DRP30_06300 [Thermotoga sp.]HDG62130.1 type II toxin-antitoxin system HicB family antitoxin [Thermotoga sp.]
MTIKYKAFIEPEDDGGFHAWVPALPGCHVQGDTKEEALKNLQEAVLLYIESLKAHGEEIPNDIEIETTNVEVSI